MRTSRTCKEIHGHIVPCETWEQEKANKRKRERKFRNPRKRFKRHGVALPRHRLNPFVSAKAEHYK